MGGDQLAESFDLWFGSVNCSADGCDVTADDDGDVTAAKFFFSNDVYLGSFASGVDRFEDSSETLSFDETESLYRF